MWLPIVLGVYWLIVLAILGRIAVVCNRMRSGSVKTESTDEKE